MRSSARSAAVLMLGVSMALAVAGCGGGSTNGERGAEVQPARDASTTMVLYRSPTCGCCEDYEEYLRRHRFDVESRVTDEMKQVRSEHGVPDDAESCHTTVVGRYVVEGHVPVEAIEDLLVDQPDIDGIALPGMPSTSPGMGERDGRPLEVVAIDGDSLSPFGSY